MPEGGARCVSHLTRGSQPAGSAGRASLAEQPDRRGWRKIDGSQRGRVHPGLTEQHAVRAQRSSKKRQTKPIEIGHKSLALRELTSDGFGLLYAKQTQFRVVEAATSEGWRCRKPAGRQAWPTLDRVAQTGVDREPQKVPNKANLESTQSSSPQKVESGLTGPAGRKQSQSRDETEIQRREERPAAFRKKH